MRSGSKQPLISPIQKSEMKKRRGDLRISKRKVFAATSVRFWQWRACVSTSRVVCKSCGFAFARQVRYNAPLLQSHHPALSSKSKQLSPVMSFRRRQIFPAELGWPFSADIVRLLLALFDCRLAGDPTDRAGALRTCLEGVVNYNCRRSRSAKRSGNSAPMRANVLQCHHEISSNMRHVRQRMAGQCRSSFAT